VESVLRLQPQLAVFDCDGTLWAGDAGEGFFDWELKRGVVSDEIVLGARPRYADYKAGKVSEEEMCGEMVTMHSGICEADVQQAATRYVEENVMREIFPELRELVHRLQERGCDVWVVSSTNEWVIQAAMKHFDIDESKILAASVRIEGGRITNQLIRVPSGAGKPQAIRDVIRKDPDAAFGNSRWDADMLAIARHAFAVNPNPDLENTARERGWTIYRPVLEDRVNRNQDNHKG
jgi:HAD superfamily phosphoserine phosphatase-like hydrolase